MNIIKIMIICGSKNGKEYRKEYGKNTGKNARKIKEKKYITAV
ncbi:hypothetical protein QUF76_11900 [Desulfobacterales bacterium HSG16]|nr:hypothetical protein [Desulfobacterales bacterium HSG16]